MLYFSIYTPDEYYSEAIAISTVSLNPNNIKSSLIFKTSSDTINISFDEDLDKYEIYTGCYGILKYKSKHKKDIKIYGEDKDSTLEGFSGYFDEELIKDVFECKYYIKKDGKIISEEDILNDLKKLVNK